MTKRTTCLMSLLFIMMLAINGNLYGAAVTDFLILGDITPYQRFTKTIDPLTEQEKTIPGYWTYNNAGVLLGADHFQFDHDDITYKTEYQSEIIGMGIVVQVTQHTGGDSDRWLLHEAEDCYRDGNDDDGRLGLLSGAGVKIREIGGKKYFYWGLGGGTYRWLSGHIVVGIDYTDLQRTKPEPIEVVQAYLAKLPSTITTTDAELKSTAYNVQWIKDEMERRLWLCDKWNLQFQAGKVSQADLLGNLVRSMKVFLNYRQKYFSVIATDDIDTLSGYLESNNAAAIQTKLSTYKTWWQANKGKSISL